MQYEQSTQGFQLPSIDPRSEAEEAGYQVNLEVDQELFNNERMNAIRVEGVGFVDHFDEKYPGIFEPVELQYPPKTDLINDGTRDRALVGKLIDERNFGNPSIVIHTPIGVVIMRTTISPTDAEVRNLYRLCAGKLSQMAKITSFPEWSVQINPPERLSRADGESPFYHYFPYEAVTTSQPVIEFLSDYHEVAEDKFRKPVGVIMDEDKKKSIMDL